MKYKFGIIGYPLGHSISPIIQKAAFDQLGIDAVYDVMETSPEDLIDRLKYIKANDYNGFNVTIPLKIPVSFFVNQTDNYAKIAGCINTIKVEGEKKELHGFNTDIYGFKAAIPKEVDLNGKTACILGTGGASRAATTGLIEKGITKIHYYTRNIINTESTLEFMREKFPNVKFESHQIQNVTTMPETAIVVNATPIGMKGFAANEQPLSDWAIKSLDKSALVYDIVYNPLTTQFLKSAQKQGLRIVEGLDMLLYQAQHAINIWTGLAPDIRDMKIAALRNL